MAEGQALEIPESSDTAVVEAIKSLNRQLRTDLMRNYLKEAGEYLYIATNATAKDADQQIKVQSCLFDAVKLCDAWNLMLTSFKVGASDILEKLHIAYLKLLDGFPDFALADVESVTKHVSSMKAACKKAEGSFTTVIKELDDTITFLEKEEENNVDTRKSYRKEYCDKTQTLEKRLTHKMLTENLKAVAKDSNLKILELELEAPRDNYHGVFKKIENGRLAKAALTLAKPKLNDALKFLVEIEQLVDKWYNECKEMVEKNMKANVKQAGKLSEAKQKEFWKPLVFVETAYNFLCRWKALQQICLSTSSHMRRVRGDIDWYYTENLYPSEAVEKAWDLKEKNGELKKKVPPRKQNKVVPDRDRVEALRTLQRLIEMALQMGGGTQFGGLNNSGGYKQQLEIIGSYLWCLCHIKGVPEILTAKQRVSKVCGDLLVGAETLRTESVSEFASGFIGCRHALDDIPRAESESSGNAEIEEIALKLPARVKSLNESDLKSAGDQFDILMTDGWNQLKKDIKEEECTAVAAEEHASAGGYFSNIGNDISRFARRKVGLLPGQKKSVSVADSIKTYQLAVDIIQEIQKQLPLDDITVVYSKMFGNLNTMASDMGGENDEPSAQERSQEWQDGVICKLMGFIDLYSANSSQVKNVEDLILRSRINAPTNAGIKWMELKQLVATDQSLYSKALAIDGEVDYKVTEQRRLERHEEKERRRKIWEEEERQRLAEEERKRKAEVERQRLAEEERQRKAEEARQRKAEEERQRKAEERQRKAEEERQRKAEEERQSKAEEERKRKAVKERQRTPEDQAEKKKDQGLDKQTKGRLRERGNETERANALNLRENEGNRRSAKKDTKKELPSQSKHEKEEHDTETPQHKETGNEEDNVPHTETGEDGVSSLAHQNVRKPQPYSSGCTSTMEYVHGNKGNDSAKKDANNGQESGTVPEIAKRVPAPYGSSGSSNASQETQV